MNYKKILEDLFVATKAGEAENLKSRVGKSLKLNIMKTKFLLPMIAMIFAIGMSFASAKADFENVIGFIQTDEGWEQVDVNCEGGNYTCKMFYSSSPTEIFVVYDAPGGSPLRSTTPQPKEVLD